MILILLLFLLYQLILHADFFYFSVLYRDAVQCSACEGNYLCSLVYV